MSEPPGADERRPAVDHADVDDFRDLAPEPVKRGAFAHLRALGPVLAPVRTSMVFLAALTALGSLAEAAVLVVVAQLAVAITDGATASALDLGPLSFELAADVPSLFAVALGCVVLRLATQLAGTGLTARAVARIQRELRSSAFRSFMVSDWGTQSAEPDGYLQELSTIYIGRTASSVQLVVGAMSAAFSFGAMMLGAFVLAPSTALIILVCVGALFVIFRPLSTWVREIANERADQGREFAQATTEAVSHALEIRTTNVTDEVTADMDDRAERLRTLEVRTDLLNLSLTPLYQGLAILALLAALGLLYATGSPAAATLGAVLLLLLRAVSYSQALQNTFHRLNELSPYAERLVAEIARYAAAAAPAGDLPVDRISDLRFEGASFTYGRGEPALLDLDLEIEPGEFLGLIGASGAGKSTFVQILLGLRQPTSGRYLVNGHSPAELDPSGWFARVAYVPQEPRMIVGSIADNIRYWRPASDDVVEQAARRAHIHDDVVSWPEGYDTPVGPRGSRLSGGQKQRLALARALVGDPDLLVLDEPTSALDLRSEALIEQTLTDLRGSVTVVVITHRLSTVSACDRLLVLDHGRVEGLGRPDEVHLTSSFYRDAVDRTATGPRNADDEG